MTPDTNAAPEAQWRAGAGPVAHAYVSDDDTAEVVRRCFSSLSLLDTRIEHAGVDAAIKALEGGRSPKILIVDIGGLSEPIAKLQRLAEFCDPATAVLVIGDRNDVVLYRNLKNLGIVEYFFKPIAPELLARTCHAALHGTEQQTAPRTGKLVVVFGVRGGVGASTIAVNVGWHLAEDLKRHVALLDLDLEGGDAALQLNVNPGRALRDALEHPERVDDLLLERAVVRAGERLGVLASLEPFKDPAIVREEAVMPLLEKLRARFRYVLVDLPHWAGLRFPRLLNEANMLLLVGDSSLASARDMVRWREQISPSAAEHSVWSILNKAGAQGGLSDLECAEAIGQEFDAIVHFDPEVAKSTNLGHPAVSKHRALTHELAPLFRSLSGEAETEGPSFFARMFGR